MDTFTALADPTRRRIVEMLAASGRLSAGDICNRFDSTPPAISQHLKVLRESKWVSMEKRAQQRIYSLRTEPFGELEEWLANHHRLWEARLARFGEAVKGKGKSRVIREGVRQKEKKT